VVNGEEAIDKCVEELTSAIQEATAASAPRRRPRADTLRPIPASIQDEIRLKNRGLRSESPGQPPPKVDDLSAERVAERTVERYAGMLEQHGPVAMEDYKEGDASSHSFAPLASAVRTSTL
jgi:hypothetical protein